MDQLSVSGGPAQPLTEGTYTFNDYLRTGPEETSYYRPGEVTVTITQVNSPGGFGTTLVTPATAKFNINGYHLQFIRQPENTTVGTNLSFSVGIFNDKNQLVPNESPGFSSDGIQITIAPVKGTTSLDISGSTTAYFDNGVVDFDLTNLAVTTAGTYKLTATEINSVLGSVGPVSDDITKGATSGAFTVR